LPSAANRNRKDAAAVPVMAIIIAKIERYFTAAAIRTAATLAEKLIIKLRYQLDRNVTFFKRYRFYRYLL